MDMPSPRRLVITWIVLSLLTVATMVTGSLGGGLSAAAIILAIAFVKARQILDIYLNLKAATAGWRALFTALVVLILAIVLAALALAKVVPVA